MPTTVERTTIPWGDTGSVATLAKMRSIVNASLVNPIVIAEGHRIANHIQARDYFAIAQTIRFFLAQNFRFIADPIGIELVRTPEFLLRQFNANGYMTGDCDDAAVIGAALGKAVGIPANFVAVGFKRNGPLLHVFTELRPKFSGVIVDLDVTKPAGNTVQGQRFIRYAV